MTGHAIITGAGRGIGRASALMLAREGALVSLLSRTRAELESLAEEISTAGGRARVVAADVRDAEALERTFADASRAQPLDALVNAAGINRPAPLTEVGLDDLEAMLDINLRGTLYACRAFGLAIPAGSPAAVVNLSSQMGLVGAPERVPYCATKHAVNGLTKALALEWAPRGIRVNAVAPTFTRTPLTARMFSDPTFLEDVLSLIPLGRIAEPEDVTGAVRFLLSSEARMITGHVLTVDGGWTAR